MKILTLISLLFSLVSCGQKKDDKKLVLVLYSTSNHYNSWDRNKFTVISKCEDSLDFDDCSDDVLSDTNYYFETCFFETSAIHSTHLQNFLDNCCGEIE